MTVKEITFESTVDFIKNDAHVDVYDKGGVPYWQHPVRVAMNVGNLFPEYAENEDVLIAALLHDVLEDTPYIYADLISRGYSHLTLDICYWLDKNSPMYKGLTYIQKIDYLADMGPTEAIAVKIADITDNSDPERPWAALGKQPEEQKARYVKALRILEDEYSSRDFAASSRAYGDALK